MSSSSDSVSSENMELLQRYLHEKNEARDLYSEVTREIGRLWTCAECHPGGLVLLLVPSSPTLMPEL